MLAHAEAAIVKDAQRLHYKVPSASFLFPVYGNNALAEDLAAGGEDMLPHLVRMQVSERVVWASAVQRVKNDELDGVT